MLTINEIKVGQSYACKFRCETMLDDQNLPVTSDTKNLKGPGVYESLGVIKTRDVDNRLVELVDNVTKRQFTIPFNDIWDIDEVEWIEES